VKPDGAAAAAGGGIFNARAKRLLHQIILAGDQVPQGPAGRGVGNPLVNPNVKGVR